MNSEQRKDRPETPPTESRLLKTLGEYSLVAILFATAYFVHPYTSIITSYIAPAIQFIGDFGVSNEWRKPSGDKLVYVPHRYGNVFVAFVDGIFMFGVSIAIVAMGLVAVIKIAEALKLKTRDTNTFDDAAMIIVAIVLTFSALRAFFLTATGLH